MTPEVFNDVLELEKKIADLKKELAEVRKSVSPEEVADSLFQTEAGPVKLSELFGDHDDLLVVHNMGVRCNYCTLWADGLNALTDGYKRRTAFVLVSPDEPSIQNEVRARRGWRFTMVSDASGEFTRAMGYLQGEGEYWPGVSGFRKQADGTIVRTGTAVFGPGDDFCPVWPLFDLIGGDKGWEPE